MLLLRSSILKIRNLGWYSWGANEVSLQLVNMNKDIFIKKDLFIINIDSKME